jgi:hypothetical protein
MITATENHPSNHSSHCSGVYAILTTESSPLTLLPAANRYELSETLTPKGSLKVLCWT